MSFLRKSWRFQNPELENNSRITQDCNIFSTSYSPTFCDLETHWLFSSSSRTLESRVILELISSSAMFKKLASELLQWWALTNFDSFRRTQVYFLFLRKRVNVFVYKKYRVIAVYRKSYNKLFNNKKLCLIGCVSL